MDNELFPVTSLEENEEGIVHLLSGGRGLTSRLASMGIMPGIKIRVLRNSGRQIIVFASDTRVALGKGQADKILVEKIAAAEGKGKEQKSTKSLLVALAGQPNVGKTTVFNLLTGLSQHVGNWPGKTVEMKEGFHNLDGFELKIVDLPGTYSLSAFSEEERVARDFIIHEKPDVVVLVVNASALERSLYLLTEILLLKTPVIVAVNMVDMAEGQGVYIDINAIQKSMRIPVVPMVAIKNQGIRELVDKIIQLAEGELRYTPRMPEVSPDHEEIFLKLLVMIKDYLPIPYNDTWVATKLMEGDPEVSEAVKGIIPHETWNDVLSLLVKHEDALRAVVGGRYAWIEETTRAAISRFKRGQVLITDRMDHVLTRPIFGVPILLGILAVIFLLTFKAGFPLQKFFETITSAFGRWIDASLINEPWWVRGILVNGVIGGAGSVLTFTPILVIFFFSMTFLENVGYMARAAFVMDRFMHIIGLHGKSFMPMCLGFGCNVPAVMGARIVESKKARLLTIFLTPFIPCTGRLAVLTFVTAAIFAGNALVVSWLLVALNIVLLGLSGILISKTLYKDEPVPFIMELPLYHKPDFRTIISVVWGRTMAFVKKAGTVILIFSVILWIMSNVPGGAIEKSLLAWVGMLFEPIGIPLGLDWKMLVALLSTIVAKENAIATLGVLYNVGEQGLMSVLPFVVSRPSAVAFLFVLMVFLPCAPTITVMRQEMGNWKLFFASVIFMIVLSYAGGVVVYQIAKSIGL
ncbi:MAG TPA: ferrous iron transport protein B [Syntrophorhabdaceae bacterium]|nr:ferrous iron transport protein B [Syntrophorhabdaceae bacterium]HQM82728.1 ferrous iron transport protein B [Syntrophorhabdaceae bacterium]